MTLSSPTPEPIAVPRAGMLATVRDRRGVVAAVEPFDGEAGRLHLVHLEYKDDHAPSEERILWEIEPSRHLVEPNALPNPAHSGGAIPREKSRNNKCEQPRPVSCLTTVMEEKIRTCGIGMRTQR